MAPAPSGAPSYVCFIAGSIFPHGFHASHLWKSFTCANTAGGGAEMLTLRTMRNSDGCMATSRINPITTTTSAIRMILSMRRSPGCLCSLGALIAQQGMPDRSAGLSLHQLFESAPEHPLAVERQGFGVHHVRQAGILHNLGVDA